MAHASRPLVIDNMAAHFLGGLSIRDGVRPLPGTLRQWNAVNIGDIAFGGRWSASRGCTKK